MTVTEVFGRFLVQPALENDLLFYPRLRLVYCGISKNASSFVKHLFTTWEKGSSARLSYPLVNPHVDQPSVVRVAELSESVARHLLYSPDITRCLILRDPVQRFMSGFFSRVKALSIERYQNPDYQYWTKLRQEILARASHLEIQNPFDSFTQSFDVSDLVEYVERTPDSLLDRHFTPQTYYSASEAISYNVVGTVDNLGFAIEELEKKTGEAAPRSDLPLLNRSNDAAPAMSAELEERVRHRYYSDMALIESSVGRSSV